jgi:hypothetical protein
VRRDGFAASVLSLASLSTEVLERVVVAFLCRLAE